MAESRMDGRPDFLPLKQSRPKACVLGRCRRVAEREPGDLSREGERCSWGGSGSFGFDEGVVFDAVALAGDGEDLSVMKEPVEDGTGGGNVLQEFAPLFDRPVAGHDGGSIFIAADADLENGLAGVPGELLEAHVVDDEQ